MKPLFLVSLALTLPALATAADDPNMIPANRGASEAASEAARKDAAKARQKNLKKRDARKVSPSPVTPVMPVTPAGEVNTGSDGQSNQGTVDPTGSPTPERR